MKEKPFNLVAVGGTFDRLHRGHKELLRTAFNIGRKVVIGITSDEMVARSKSNAKINSLEKRREVLERWIKEEGLCDLADYEIVVINDVYGVTIYDEKLETLVVSEETLERALTINKLRRDRGLRPLTIVVVPMVLAYNGKPISSTRIRRGEIDQEGKPLVVR
ncbi:MAG: phosphopantetheine adenylyltransferase [Candidatus Nezhaarchaeales archaeon]